MLIQRTLFLRRWESAEGSFGKKSLEVGSWFGLIHNLITGSSNVSLFLLTEGPGGVGGEPDRKVLVDTKD